LAIAQAVLAVATAVGVYAVPNKPVPVMTMGS